MKYTHTLALFPHDDARPRAWVNIHFSEVSGAAAELTLNLERSSIASDTRGDRERRRKLYMNCLCQAERGTDLTRGVYEGYENKSARCGDFCRCRELRKVTVYCIHIVKINVSRVNNDQISVVWGEKKADKTRVSVVP